MIEKVILDYLSSELSCPVYMEEPARKIASYVVIEKTGSRENNHIYTATFAIQSYGTSLYNAAVLNAAVKEAMDNIVTLGEVAACQLNSDYNFTDPETKRYRYQAVFDLIHY